MSRPGSEPFSLALPPTRPNRRLFSLPGTCDRGVQDLAARGERTPSVGFTLMRSSWVPAQVGSVGEIIKIRPEDVKLITPATQPR